MTLVELLSTLRTRDINLWVEGGRLRYSAPSGALTPEIREELAKHKADILAFLNETDRARRLTRGPISRISREAKLPASINQKRMWFLDQLQANTAFNCSNAFRIKGSLNIASLEQSLNEIVRRHEALRTTFSAIDGEPIQVIAPVLNLRLTIIDLRDILDSTERETEAERIITGEVETPFDLAKGPLFRAHLLRHGTDEHLLLLTIHHIVTDGWSTGILVKELTVLYEAFCNRRPSPLPDLPVQYADFAHWQSQCLQGEVLQQELSHWKERLKGAPEVTELPMDYVRPAVQNFQGASEPVLIPKNLTEALKALSRSQGVTLFMTLLAALKTLLYRYSGQEQLVLGSPIAGRIRSEIENVIGLFINTLVLRTDLSGDPSFRELLGRVRQAALEAYAHQDVPFEKLIEDLHVERSLSYTPLFQVMFVLQNTPESELKLAGLTVSPVKIERETSLFDLFLALTEGEQGLKGTLSYKTDLFDRTTISHMIGRFHVLLRGIVADPNRPISTLPLLNETEKHQLLVEWNDTTVPNPRAKCVNQLFEEQVERTPDAIAVFSERQKLRFRELNNRANRLAHHLRKQGVGPEVLVGICMERSLDMLVGLLGVLKTGGAYVPLDPNHPAERLAFMLQDTNAPILLTQHRLIQATRDSKPGFSIFNSQLKVICLDSEWEVIARESEENPRSEVTTDNLAYVVYTSGSTGKPKGVQITHRALNNFAAAACASSALEPGDRVLQFASISFDAAAEEIYPSLISGAGVVLRNDSMLESVSSFLQRCAEWGVTVLDLPTAYWHELAEEMAAESLTLHERLRLVIIGGERAVPERLAQWRKAAGDRVRLLNTYGPTETTVVATTWELAGAAATHHTAREIPIGRPIANTQIYILDSHLQPVPVGVRGALYISGVGLARGYLNRADLTAAMFIPNPFSKKPGARLYKTGDLARYLPDGNIEFLGRLDHQVKIRGFRIEPGEVESVLAQHPGVQQAMVMAREGGSPTETDKRLVAYVVPRQSMAKTPGDLRDFLRQKLPHYMVPASFVFLDALPLTPNGKIDPKAMPAPEEMRPALTEGFVPARNPIEAALVEIWARLLGLERVGVHDNFFDLGGHSLLAVRLFTEIEKGFNKRPALAALFEEPTIEHLAKLISQDRPSTIPNSLVAIQPRGARIPFFCVHEFFGDVFCYRNLSQHLGDDQPFYALQPRGLDDPDEPFTDVEAMASYYIDIIRTVQPHGPYALGGLCFGGVIALEMAQQLRAKGEAVALVALLDSGIGLGYSGLQWWWRFFQNFPLDFRSWLAGSLQLTRGQWLDVIKIKSAVAKGRLVNFFRPSTSTCQQKGVPSSLRRLGDVFQFSERHHRIARAQYRALKGYKPRSYSGRLTLFRARMQPFFSSHDPHKGWSRVGAGGVEVRHIPGNHLGMLQEPHVQVLARELKACLDREDWPENEPKSHFQK